MSSVGQSMSYLNAARNLSNKPTTFKKKPNSVNARDSVPFWWDFENLKVEMKDLPALLKKIETCLRTRDSQLRLSSSQLFVVGNFEFRVREQIELAGFTVLETRKYALFCSTPGCTTEKPYRKGVQPKPYERVKEVADRIIVQGFIEHILDDTGSKNVMVVSGDSDFGLPLRILRDSGGYKVYLAVGEEPRDELRQSASTTWKLSAIVQGSIRPIYRHPQN